MKRQRGRNRGGGGGGGKPQQQNANRAFDSNGPEGVKVRGNAQHVFEKYQQLARDAASSGDRVLAESYLQHAEHYFRVVRAMQPQKPTAEILGRDQFSSGFDIDFEDESGAQAAAAAEAAAAEVSPEGEAAEAAEGEAREPRGERWRDERPRDRDRDDRPRGDRDDRQRGDRFEGQGRRDRWRDRDDRQRDRDDRPRGDRDDRPREAREDRPRDDRPPREDRQRDDRPRGEREDRPRRDRDRDRDREDRGDRDPLPVVEPQAAPLVTAREERASPVLRDDDGGESHAPAFLKPARAPKAAPVEAEAGEEKPKPRRRRAPRSFEGDGAPSNEAEEA